MSKPGTGSSRRRKKKELSVAAQTSQDARTLCEERKRGPPSSCPTFRTLRPPPANKTRHKTSPPHAPKYNHSQSLRLRNVIERSHLLLHTTTVMANPNAGHFFQTSESLVSGQRKAAKAKNKLGRPIKLSSKLLAVTPDPFDERAVYVAEAAGEVRRVVLEVSF